MKIKIRERRLVKGLTQQELADKCGCSRQFINQIEADGSINVSSKLLYKIAEALECPIDDIFFDVVVCRGGQDGTTDNSRCDD